MDNLENNGGWLGALILLLAGGVKYFWDYLKKKSDDETKVKLNEEDKNKLSKDELTFQYNSLLNKFNELEDKFEHTEKQLDKALTAFEIILPLITKLLEDKPEYKPVFETALKHFKKE